jgi:hypothetical protein
MKLRPRLIARPKDPLVVNRELDLLFVLCWWALSAWGIISTIKGVPSVQAESGVNYGFLWSLGVTVSAIGAAIFGALIFFKTPIGQVTKKRLERTCCWAMFFFVAYYPVALALQGKIESASLVMIFLFLPLYRARVLTDRIKHYANAI